MALAWSDFMAEYGRIKWPPPEVTSLSERVTPILNAILARSGPAALAAHGAMGRHLNQLMWFARGWTTAQLPRLLDGGSEDPGTRPAWAVYLESNDVVPIIFPNYRQWYARHADWLPTDGVAPVQDPDWSLGQPFALHVVWACVHGACAPGDADRLVENTFSRVPVDARRHAYWALWRGFTDARRVRVNVRRNFVAFWANRLDALERMPRTADRDEEVDGMCQLIGTPHIPVRDSIRLGQRTTALLGGKQRVSGMLWDRLESLARRNARGTFVILERMLNAVLASDYPYVSFDDAAPALRLAIAAGGDTRERALAMVNRLGAAGFTEFGSLWDEAQE